MHRAVAKSLRWIVAAAVLLGIVMACVVFFMPSTWFPETNFDAIYLSKVGGADELLKVIEERALRRPLSVRAWDPHLYDGPGVGAIYWGAFRVAPVDVSTVLTDWGLRTDDHIEVEWRGGEGILSNPCPDVVRPWFPADSAVVSVWTRRGTTWIVDEESGRFWFYRISS